MKEIWRAVVEYEGYYEVSSFGRVKSLPRMTARGMMGGQLMTPVKNKNGYLTVKLCKEGKIKAFYIHRLVAEAFIPNPDNLPQVNHKDEVKTNNHVSNLEWITIEGNLNYRTRNERIAKANSKPVAQKTLDGELVKIWPSVMEVERQTGWSQRNISKCCNGKRKSAYGYVWSYINVS